MRSRFTHLECHECEKKYDINIPQNYCPDCSQPLVARYDLSKPLDKAILHKREHSMWRYEEFLPVFDQSKIVSLGEGWTPILPLKKISAQLGVKSIDLKEEGGNPTGSFKARGISMAVSKANELGIKEFCIPTAGNAGSALAAYAAKMDGIAHIYMPEATPKVFQKDCEIMGARVTKVIGSIKDAGIQMNADRNEKSWWDITTLKEPFRLEGKKTMGLEIAEQYGWKLPDVIIYPTGGGTGLIGIWKAFQELKDIGWIDHIPTRMIAVQTTACDPVVQAFQARLPGTEVYQNPKETIANGLRVPKAFGDKLIMKTLYESNGYALSYSDEKIISRLENFAQKEGLFLSPEGGAVIEAIYDMKEKGLIQASDRVLALNTGSGYKYIENLL